MSINRLEFDNIFYKFHFATLKQCIACLYPSDGPACTYVRLSNVRKMGGRDKTLTKKKKKSFRAKSIHYF